MKQKLIRLQDRLQGLGYHHRSIQLLKLYPKWGFDLTELWPIQGDNFILELQELIKTPNMSIPILNRINLDLQAKKIDKQLIQLHHYVSATEEETGRYDLAIGYPFLNGTLADGTFIQAPLVLYPVQLIRSETYPYQWKLCRLDAEPRLNHALLLALQKHHSVVMDESVLEDTEYLSLANDPLLANWAGWLRSYQVRVFHDEGLIEPFHTYSRQNVPLESPLELKPFLVLASFPQGSTALLDDYQQLLQSVEVRTHPLIAALLQQKPILRRGQAKDPNGTEPFYLLPTDPAQEAILKQARTEPALVVSAPPGTGKSQLVTNLITDALAQTKKVLIISNKRTILDTVAQQLEKLGLAPYFGQMYDEKADRAELYAKINQLTTKFYSNIPNHEPFIPKINQKIEEHEQKLSELHKALHEVQPFGLSAYQLYCQAKPIEHTIEVADIAYSIHQGQFKKITATLSRYAKYYEKYNKENYILKSRHSFADMDDEDIYQLNESIEVMISKAQNLSQRIKDLNVKEVTPKYLWSISKDLEQIPIKLKPTDLNLWEKTRLKIWTNWQGKELIQGLSKKIVADNKADVAGSWEETSQQLLLMGKIAQMSLELNNDLEKLKKVFVDKQVTDLQDRLADGDIPIETLKLIRKSLLDDFHQLKEMDRIYQHSTPILRTLIERLIACKDIKEFPLGKVWTQVVNQSLYHYWIQTIEEKNPILSIVSTDEIGKIQESYRHLLEEKRKLSQQVLLSDLQYGTNQLLNRYPRELQDLRYQTEKREKIWSVRKLIHSFYNRGLLEILPVWLVTPEIASTIFPLEKECFDLLIVDEAGQCPVEQCISSIFRSNQMVVIGDEKQVIGDQTVLDDEQSENESEEPKDSLFQVACQSFDKQPLRYHYSSLHEELFSFSNQAFYRGKLLTIPNTSRMLEQPAIYWQSTEHPEIEAEEAIRLLDLLLLKYPNRSIGIISFHEKQKEAILDLLELALQSNREFRKRYHRAMEKSIDQRLFIKTVEQAQGLRRDMMILSLGYTKNDQDKVQFYFDTLGLQDGENYVNIAITRAQERLFVLSSIEPEEIDEKDYPHSGPLFLKQFLEYTKGIHNQSLEQVSQVINKVNPLYMPQKKGDTLLEDLLYQALTKRGYTVDREVGFSPFQVDLAVVHPHQPEQYILGLQCDGGSYQMITDLQEREIHRPKLLENRGWTIKQVWSRNWWNNSEELLDAIEQTIDRLTQHGIAIEELHQAHQETSRQLQAISEEQEKKEETVIESVMEESLNGLKIRVETKKSIVTESPSSLVVIEETNTVEEQSLTEETNIVVEPPPIEVFPQETDRFEESNPDPIEDQIATYHWLDQPTPSNDPDQEIDHILLFYNNR